MQQLIQDFELVDLSLVGVKLQKLLLLVEHLLLGVVYVLLGVNGYRKYQILQYAPQLLAVGGVFILECGYFELSFCLESRNQVSCASDLGFDSCSIFVKYDLLLTFDLRYS